MLMLLLFFFCLDLGSFVGLPCGWNQRILFLQTMPSLPCICLCDVGLADPLLHNLQTVPSARCYGLRKHEQCNQGSPDPPAAAALPSASASRRILPVDGCCCW